MKLSCRTLDFGKINPKELAKMLSTTKVIRSGFNKVTSEVCYSLAKGIVSFDEASRSLDLRLSSDFKDTPDNRKRKEACQVILSNFHLFLVEEGLKCLNSFTKMKIDLGDNSYIQGHGCAVFKNAIGAYCGVVLTDMEFDFASTLRIPVEQYWISKRVKSESVKIYVYDTSDHSYQIIHYASDRIDVVLAESKQVIQRVSLELKKLAS